MKKYLLPIMALALTFTFVACGDDDDDPAPSNQQQQQGGQQGGSTTVNYLYSFAKKSYALVDETTVTLSITNAKDGSSVIANEDIKVTLNVVADETTAVEGTDFEIPTKEVTIPKGKDKVEFTVKAKTTDPASDKNTIVIKPTFAIKNISAGLPDKAKIVLIGSFAKDLLGTWVMNELKTTKEDMIAMWSIPEDYENWPEFNANDELTIDATIVPAFQSGIKNFFIGEATYEDAGSYTLMGFPAVEMQILKVTGVNRDFSANSTSANNVAFIGVRNIDDGNGNVLLDVYLIDFVPTDFAQTAASFGCYDPIDDTGYCAVQSSTYVNFTMKKKAE